LYGKGQLPVESSFGIEEEMLSVAYVSSATSKLSQEELIELMHLIREKNPKVGVSGMLLYCEGHFMQVIEGPEEKVMPLYETIQADPRHDRVVTLFEETIEERRFKEWTMGLRQLTARELEQVSGWTGLREAADRVDREDRANRDAVYELLMTFRRTMG